MYNKCLRAFQRRNPLKTFFGHFDCITKIYIQKYQNAFLRHLTYEGAKIRYGEITDAITERLDFELEVIEKTGYPGYFLIVEDFIREARNMDVSVGPGRGSAAGSVVAAAAFTGP